MRFLPILTILFAILAAWCVAASDDGDDHVAVLTATNFDSFIGQELSLVEFYAPWCGHCKSLEPEYKAAAAKLFGSIPLGKVDATVESQIASRYSVSGYPTLKIFRNGKPSDYEGPRKADGIVSYMKKQVGPAAKPLNTLDEINALIAAQTDYSYVILGIFTNTNTQLHSSFSILSNRLRSEFTFGKIVNQPEILQHYGLTSKGEGIVAILDNKSTTYEGTSQTSQVEKFIRENSVALVGEITESNQDIYNKRNAPVLKFLFKVNGATQKTKTYYINRITKVAEKYKGKVTVTYGDKTSFKSEWEHFNFKDAEIGVLLENRSNQKSYRFEDSFNVDSINTWVQSVLDNQIKVYKRSEIPPKFNDTPVKVVVGSTFDDIVFDDSKDVMIEFYAPWCGHCKSLEPKYNQLAERLSSNPNLVIAKIDATANDYDREKFSVSGYPSIFFKPADSRRVMKYDGDREVDKMMDFIKEHARFDILTGNKKAKKSKSKKSKNSEL